MKISLPEYTADLGILGRIGEGFGKDNSYSTDSARARVWRECLDERRGLKVGDLGDVVLGDQIVAKAIIYVWLWGRQYRCWYCEECSRL